MFSSLGHRALKLSLAVGDDLQRISWYGANFRGIKVGFAGNVLTEATAELAVALLLATSRRIPEAVNSAKKYAFTLLALCNFRI